MRASRLLPGAPLARIAPIALAITASIAPAGIASAKPPVRQHRVDPSVHIRERASGVARLSPALRALTAPTTPVTIQLDHDVTAADIAALEAAGATIARSDRGSVLGRGAVVAAELPAGVAQAIGAVPGVKRVALDGSVLPAPRPIDGTMELVGGEDVWGLRTSSGVPLDGQGVTICDVDSGVDVFHPLFFRADGGYFDWIDTNGNGVFDVGVDQVDVGNGPVTIRALNGIVSHYYDETPLFGSEDPKLDLQYDFLYADEDGSGEREFGPDAGFTEETPGYGERMFAVDDVNGNGKLDAGEKLVALGTSKIKAFRIDNKVYRRGTNLITAPWDDSMLHGTGASGILVAGVPGLTNLSGMAPGADLVMATDTLGGRDYQMTSFCISEGARVVLHEYAPWVGYPLDGSTATEKLIDSSSADGVSHVNPAGNLSTSQKLYKRTVPGGATTDIAIDVPDNGAYFLGLSLIWRDTSRDLALTLNGPNGLSQAIDTSTPAGQQVAWEPGVTLYAFRQDSDRGTALVTIYVVADSGAPPGPSPGAYSLHVVDPSPPGSPDLPLIAYVQDDVSGWGLGANFPEYSSEDHLIGYPGTADHGMPISAFTGHDWDGATPGERAYYSGRGYRIDGQHIMWIGGPDDPVTTGHFEDQPLSYIVFGGTSGASPHVAGSAALIVESDPTLTGDGVKDKIKAGAVVDSFTGAVPNDDFGWGKVNVYRSIYGKDAPGGTAPSIHADDVTMAPGSTTEPITVSDPDEPASGLVIDVDHEYDGTFDETLASPELALAYDSEGDYRVKLRVTDSTGRSGAALVRVHVASGAGGSGGAGGGPVSRTIDVAGGGCSTSGSPLDAPAWGAIVALGIALRRRSRSRAARPRT